MNWLFAAGFLLEPLRRRATAHPAHAGRQLHSRALSWLKLSWMWIAFFTAGRRHQSLRRPQLSTPILGRLQTLRRPRPHARLRAPARVVARIEGAAEDCRRSHRTMSLAPRNTPRVERIRDPSARRRCMQHSVEVIDDSHLHAGHAGARDGKGHFRVRVVSRAFAGCARATASARLSLARRADADRYSRTGHRRAHAGRSQATCDGRRLKNSGRYGDLPRLVHATLEVLHESRPLCHVLSLLAPLVLWLGAAVRPERPTRQNLPSASRR